MADWITTAKLVVWGAGLARKFGPFGKKLVSDIKRRASLDLTQELHTDFVHKFRKLASANRGESWHSAGPLVADVCNACRLMMGNILELKRDEIHCCIKIFKPAGQDSSVDQVETLTRSDPRDTRPITSDRHPVSGENTVWSCLMGGYDGVYNWKNPFKCFICNDLTKFYPSRFRCSRKDFGLFYKSTLVFPIRYLKNTDTEYVITGFLAFDSPKTKAFLGFPDTFDFVDNHADYYNEVRENAAFHLGAALADTLGIVFEPITT